VPKSVYPVILAHGKIVHGRTMILDARSYLRGIELVKFIEHYIGRTTVKADNVTIWNKIHCNVPEVYEKIFQHDYDELFSSTIVEVVDTDDYMNKLEAYMKKHGNLSDSSEEKMVVADKFMRENDKFREFEQFSMENYYEEEGLGIQWFVNALKMREAAALKRFSGEKNYTMLQLVQELVNNLPWQK